MGVRYYEVDAVRGTALLLMVLYHILFCLYFFGIIRWFDPQAVSGAAGAAVFIFIAGLSLILAGRKPARTVKRGLQLLFFALIITAVTGIIYPQGFVVFGILHLIGCGTILAIPFLSGKVQWFIPAVSGNSLQEAGEDDDADSGNRRDEPLHLSGEEGDCKDCACSDEMQNAEDDKALRIDNPGHCRDYQGKEEQLESAFYRPCRFSSGKD